MSEKNRSNNVNKTINVDIPVIKNENSDGSTRCREQPARDLPVQSDERKEEILYPVDSCPPWPIVFFYAVQQVVSTLGGLVTAAFIVSKTVCAEDDQQFTSHLIGTTVFMSGLCTFLQVTFGLRLPILQGSSFVFISILVSMSSTPQWKCPSDDTAFANNESRLVNVTNNTAEASDNWRPRLLEASGSLIAASVVQVLLGCCGIIGFMMRYIGPLTISITITFVGLSMISVIMESCQHQWAVAIFTIVVFLTVFAFLKDVSTPCPTWTTSRGWHVERYQLFRLFPQLIAIVFGWSLCAILTAANVLPETPDVIGYKARTDTHIELIKQINWFFLPYPLMWGLPTISLATFSGMVVATFCSTIESIGDYYATARACSVPPPPKHAMNRGIAAEGFGGIICGLMGSGHSTTSLSQTIGFLSITGMTSRITWQVAGVIFMAAGMFGKLSAVLASMPDPVVGGFLVIGLGMVVSVGLSNLQFIDLSSGRNHVILGISMLLAFVVPLNIKENPALLNTGMKNVDQFLTVLLGNGIMIGGSLAFILDNLLPGTQEERGFLKFNHECNQTNDDVTEREITDIYNLPSMTCSIRCCTDKSAVHKENTETTGFCCRFLTYLPFLPCYIDRHCKACSISYRKCCRRSDKADLTSENNTVM